MPSCKFGDHLYPFEQNPADMMDDLDALFGDDEDEIFRGVDLTKVDIDDLDISVFENTYYSEDESDSDFPNPKVREIRNHDCMWGGQCCKDYQRTQPPPPRPPAAAPPAPATTPSVLITHSTNKVVTIQKCMPAGKCSDRTDVVVVTNNVRTPAKTEGRSLLLNRTTVQPQQQASPSPAKTPRKRDYPSSRPETPQSMSGSDDDLGPIPIDPHNTTSIFRSALDALPTPPTGDWEDEAFLYGSDAKRTKDNEPVPSQTDILRLSASATSDHNYDGSSKNLRLEGLGVETPSDSEEDEEIDVVSLSERSASSRSSSCGGLPTRPTPSDQEHLEEFTTSLLSASKAVSRKIKKFQTKHKRRKYRTDSSEEDEDSPRYIKCRKSIGFKATPTRGRKISRFGEEGDSKEKRDLHNNMERLRRIDLRNSFDDLKSFVPCLSNRDRVAKVVILREAANYCYELSAESRSKQLQVQALKKQQEVLRATVSNLRRQAARSCLSARRY